MKAMKNLLKIGICVGVAAVAVALVWHFLTPYARKLQWSSGAPGNAATASVPLTFLPQYEDGSGQAGVALQLPEMRVVYDTPGWQPGEKGWWYACDSETCYANGWVELDGDTYHFDSDGYMSKGGWIPIGGAGYYFDERGVHRKEKDSSKMIALTFDDGPSEHTSRLLKTLEENGSCASFMMLGTSVSEYGAVCVPHMARMGCTIGNHSFDHPDMTQLSEQEAAEQLARTDELIELYNNGNGATTVRFPYGSYNQELAKATGRPCFYWDVDVNDYNFKNAKLLANAVLNEVEGGCIVLLHDTNATTVDACAELIPALIEQGYELVSLETLAAARGFTLEPGVTYFGFTDREIANGTATDK